MDRKLLSILFVSTCLLSVCLHPVQANPSTIESLRGCLPEGDDISFRIVDQVDVEDSDSWRFYLVMVKHRNNVEWGTVPELLKDGSCVNQYPRQHVDVDYSKLPDAVARRFKSSEIEARRAEWEAQEAEMRRLSEERGIPVNRLGWD